MKKTFLIALILLFTSGCVYVNSATKDEIINDIITKNHKFYNHYNRGFKFYLPRDMSSTKADELNEVLNEGKLDYYLFVDLVSYDKKKEVLYEENKDIYFSRIIELRKKKGIVNITKEKDYYLIRITYNYATIEVKCEEKDINAALTNSLVIALSVEYNDDVIKKLLEENVLIGEEEAINIFGNKDDNGEYLEVDDTYNGDEMEDYDPDVIVLN